MKITVANICDDRIYVDGIEPCNTIEELKNKICEKNTTSMQITPNNQRLIFNHQKLENEKTLSDYKIEDDAKIYILITSAEILDPKNEQKDQEI